MQRTVFLFDVDGVLVHPRGYKEALRATLDVIAERMGQPPIRLTDDEISVFEAVHLTNEWDSAAMVATAMLIDVLTAHPDLCRATLDETEAAVRASGVTVPRRDLSVLARQCMTNHAPPTLPSTTIAGVLRPQAPDCAQPLIDELLRDIYHWRSPATFIFQHYTLGAKGFVDTYGENPLIDCDSYLSLYDKPLLLPEMRDRLLERITQPEWDMALFTARSSRWPADYANGHEGNQHLYSPEGDLAAELLGLAGRCPLIASGRLAWLATKRKRGIPEYVKPSPVHALAAIGAAISGSECAALEAAAELVETGTLIDPLARLQGDSTRVVVFEDASGGIRATRGAVEMLRAAGLDVTAEAVGVSPHPAKQESLGAVADRVVNDVNEALELYL